MNLTIRSAHKSDTLGYLEYIQDNFSVQMYLDSNIFYPLVIDICITSDYNIKVCFFFTIIIIYNCYADIDVAYCDRYVY